MKKTEGITVHRVWVYVVLIFVLTFIAVSSLFAQSNRVFNILAYGARSGGDVDNAVAIQKAIDACSLAGGGRVLVPAGQTFMSGPISLKSFVELFVDAGSILLANPDEKKYITSAFKENRGEGMVWIDGDDLTDISFGGTGAIDGNGVAFMGPELGDSYDLKPISKEDPRPHLLTLVGCRKIRIRQLTFRNAAYWTIHLAGCQDVVIAGISLLNNLKIRNSDGIDIDHSKDVRISDCLIESGDDCICLKNRREYQQYGVCENIVVNNCVLTSRSCAIKIGSENTDSIRHALFTNCIITKSNRGIGIQNRDEGTVTDILFSDILIDAHYFSDVWWGKAEPIYITAYPRAAGNTKDENWRFPKGVNHGTVGRVSGIYFNNIHCRSENGVYISGSETAMITDIHLSNVQLKINKTTAIAGGVYDRRPANAEGLIKTPTSGFYFDTADSIFLTDCSVQWGPVLADYFGSAIKSIRVPSLELTNFSGHAAFAGKIPDVIEQDRLK